jgi:hypothetical protein
MGSHLLKKFEGRRLHLAQFKEHALVCVPRFYCRDQHGGCMILPVCELQKIPCAHQLLHLRAAQSREASMALSAAPNVLCKSVRAGRELDILYFAELYQQLPHITHSEALRFNASILQETIDKLECCHCEASLSSQVLAAILKAMTAT